MQRPQITPLSIRQFSIISAYQKEERNKEKMLIEAETRHYDWSKALLTLLLRKQVEDFKNLNLMKTKKRKGGRKC